MVVVLALVLAAAFGAGDQYLGSLSAHPWMTDVSLLSAPWLVLPFLAGCTQAEPRRAALLGFACTLSALIGYGLMTLSPIEGAHVNATSVAGFARSESAVFIGSVVTGPLFGWFGQRWRADGAWLGAVATAAALCVEPFARIPAGHAIRSSAVLIAEVAAGTVLIVYVATTAVHAPGRSTASTRLRP